MLLVDVRRGMVHAHGMWRLCVVLWLLSQRVMRGRRRVTSSWQRSTSMVHLRSGAGSGGSGVWRRHNGAVSRGVPVAGIVAVLARAPTLSVR